MNPAWNDSDNYIEDRSRRGEYLKRELLSRWDGHMPRPTFVFGVYAQLDGPVPPFNGFGVVLDYAGDNPDIRMAQTALRTPDIHPGPPQVYHDSGRRYDNIVGDDELRSRVFASRERFHDEPYWEHQQRRGDHGGRGEHRPRPYGASYNSSTRTRSSYSASSSDDSRVGQHDIRSVHSMMRIIENPDLELAPRGPDGHPMSAWAMRQANPDTASVDDACPPPAEGYAEQEEERLARARERPVGALKGPYQVQTWREGNSRAMGRFYRRQIVTIEQAYNLVAFLDVGQQEAYELFALTVQNLAAFPQQFRTEGEAHLMRYQQDIERAWWTVTTGGPRAPRAVRHGNPLVRPTDSSSTTRRVEAKPAATRPPPPLARGHEQREFDIAQTRAYGPPVVPAPTSARDRPSPAAQPRPTTPLTSADGSPGFLGRSQPNPSDARPTFSNGAVHDASLTPNTRWTAGDLHNRHARTHPSVWRRGVRGFSGVLATALGDTPNRPDILASNTTTALAPNTLQADFRAFVLVGMRLFSVRGLYDLILRLGEYPVETAAMEHYPYSTENLTIFLVAAWYARHGILPGSPDVLALEDFARVRRNVVSGIPDLNNTVWPEAPGSAAALQTDASQVPHWDVLRHAPVQSAGGGIHASVHAPMEDVEGPTAETPAVGSSTPPPVPQRPKQEEGAAGG
ncbi:hypothetical protein B0H16DRAFT_1464235 [Mycena metata]|uniref:Uncharacterized protein n=1 Tax=Mycena metata TaxID=1033252 RepID=A0AAD7IFS7_9AGAR|nr:hypothetical protein B0H16DRAFT_1464235 [Mycena metata]